jgi:hypothetical protein
MAEKRSTLKQYSIAHTDKIKRQSIRPEYFEIDPKDIVNAYPVFYLDERNR